MCNLKLAKKMFIESGVESDTRFTQKSQQNTNTLVTANILEICINYH